MKPKFKIGDKVEIINYGHRFWSYEEESSYAKLLFANIEEGYKVYDALPHLVGQKGVIDAVNDVQGRPFYSIKGPDKHAWYDENQLQLINE